MGGRLLALGPLLPGRPQRDSEAVRKTAILVAAHRNYEDALDDLIEYQDMYPDREFELEHRDDGRAAPWRVMLRITRRRPWQRWPFVKSEDC